MEAIRMMSSAPPAFGCGSALLVEEDVQILSSLRETLVAAGFEVHCAAGPSEAQRLLARHPYQLVVTDLQIAGANGAAGLDVISRARELNPFSRIVALTATEGDVPRALLETIGVEICRPIPGNVDRLRIQIAAMVRTTRSARIAQERSS